MPQSSTPSLDELFKEPKEIAELANLVYVTDKGFTIERHPHGRGFCYKRNDKKITNKKELERIKNLVIPPGWKEVRITHLKNGHLQVVGRDDKDRKVYRYHEL